MGSSEVLSGNVYGRNQFRAIRARVMTFETTFVRAVGVALPPAGQFVLLVPRRCR